MPMDAQRDAERARTMTRFSLRLCKIMRQRGLTYVEMGKRCGISAGYLSNMCNGRRAPTLMTLLRLRRGLGCTWEELMGE